MRPDDFAIFAKKKDTVKSKKRSRNESNPHETRGVSSSTPSKKKQKFEERKF